MPTPGPNLNSPRWRRHAKCLSQTSRRALWLPLTASLALLAAIAGCESDGSGGLGRCNDIPQGAIPQPNGTFNCQWEHAQMAVAREDRFMIYQYEWYMGGKQLGPFGQRHVAEIAAHLHGTSEKVAIEPHWDSDHNMPDEALNKARIEAVALVLATNGVPDAFDRVILAAPRAEGLGGDEALRIAAQRAQSSTIGGGTNSGGPFGGVGTTSSVGGFGGIGAGGVGGGF